MALLLSNIVLFCRWIGAAHNLIIGVFFCANNGGYRDNNGDVNVPTLLNPALNSFWSLPYGLLDSIAHPRYDGGTPHCLRTRAKVAFTSWRRFAMVFRERSEPTVR